jgi:CubicO group peptidase (beta-lactamase class C family)
MDKIGLISAHPDDRRNRMKRLLGIFIIALGLGLNAETALKKIDDLMKAYSDSERFMGTVLVAEKGTIVYENGFGFANLEWNIRNDPGSVFNIASITKTFTGVLTLQLVQEGKLKLDHKISDFLPFYRKDIGEKVTLHQLLTHSSGIPNFLQIPGFMKDRLRDPMGNLEDFILKYCSLDLEFEPGAKFAYNNSGYVILGAIIEKVTGLTFEEALKRKILEPCGMTHSGMDSNRLVIAQKMTGYTRKLDGSFDVAPYWDRSWAYSAGQMYSCTRDLWKFHQALMGETLLKKEYQEMMYKPYFPAFKTMRYGYGWTIREVPDRDGRMLKVVSHEGGIYGVNSYFQRIPQKDQVVVLLNNTQNTPGKEISDCIFAILNGTVFSFPKKSIAREMYRELNKQGITTALRRYDEWKKTKEKGYDFSEKELNDLGYDLLGSKRIDEAIAVFQKNTESYPLSGNAFDSLAEGHLTRGDKPGALAFYKKAVELDPTNEKAKKVIAELEK